jgi:hypothetical protein
MKRVNPLIIIEDTVDVPLWGSLRLAPTSVMQGLFGASLSKIASYPGSLMGGELQPSLEGSG